MRAEDMTKGMRTLMNTFCYLWIGAWAVIFGFMAISTIQELGGWSLVKKANDTFGQLLAAVAAIVALSFAYHEYRLRSAPVFYCKVVPKDLEPEEAIRHFYIISSMPCAIHLETRVIGRVPSWVTVRCEYPDILLEPQEKTSPISISFDPRVAAGRTEDEIVIHFFGRSSVNAASRVVVETVYLPALSLGSFADRAHTMRLKIMSPLR